MSEQHRKEYLARIHRAQDYIEKNIAEPLTLEAVARAAYFSPYHFHRIFTAITGETLYQFILRVRLERAASQLCQVPDKPVTEIALECGFSSSATFARAFNSAFAMSASEFRKICKTDRKKWKDLKAAALYSGPQDDNTHSRSPEMKSNIKIKKPESIEVRDMTSRQLAYVRHVGPYAGDPGLFERLWGEVGRWAGPRGLFGTPQCEMISVYHDDPGITDEKKLRLSLGITVPAGTEPGPGMNLLEIPAGKYVCARFEVDASEFGAAWNFVMGEWMSQSGWQCDDRPAYECCLNDPKTHPQGKHLVEIRVGVKPL